MKNDYKSKTQKSFYVPSTKKGIKRKSTSISRSTSIPRSAGMAPRPSFEWRGCLSDLKDKYTSVQLQHKIWEEILQTINH
jgi:hypothetical protein